MLPLAQGPQLQLAPPIPVKKATSENAIKNPPVTFLNLEIYSVQVPKSAVKMLFPVV